MKTTDFVFDLPDELIAQHPSERRGASRLMVLDRERGSIEHRRVAELPLILPEEVAMVFNDSRVRKARLYARRETSETPHEFLLVRELDAHRPDGGLRWEAMTRKPRRLKDGETILFPGDRAAQVTGHDGMFVHLVLDEPLDERYFATHGHVPLPPYIARDDAPEDEERYQTVYADKPGSVAAPTAGLHFTDELLAGLCERGTRIERVTLHVGIGTFLPVRVENLDEHRMHEEVCELGAGVAERLNAHRAAGGRLLAVGTTSVRTLESAWDRTARRLTAFRGPTDLFIRPGYEFGALDALFTNFHTPRSTLLMLVSAFAGREFILHAYEEAVRERYRFFSYGDAMLIL